MEQIDPNLPLYKKQDSLNLPMKAKEWHDKLDSATKLNIFAEMLDAKKEEQSKLPGRKGFEPVMVEQTVPEPEKIYFDPSLMKHEAGKGDSISEILG